MVEFGWHPQRKTRKCLEYRETRIPIEAAEELYLEIGNRQESDEKARVYKTSWWNLLRDTVSADRDLHLYEFAFSPKNCTAQHSLQTLIAPPAHTLLPLLGCTLYIPSGLKTSPKAEVQRQHGTPVVHWVSLLTPACFQCNESSAKLVILHAVKTLIWKLLTRAMKDNEHWLLFMLVETYIYIHPKLL